MSALLTFDSVWDFLKKSADAHPDARYIAFEGEYFSYSDIARRAEGIARALIADGLEPNDRVGLLEVNTPDAVATLFGILRAGGTVVPVNFRLKEEELAYIFDNCTTRVLFLGGRYVPLITSMQKHIPSLRRLVVMSDPPDSLPEGVMTLDDFIASGATLPDNEFAARALDGEGIIIYTSGTTGRPKGALLPQEQWLHTTASPERQEQRAAFAQMVGPPLVAPIVLPFYHIAGLGVLFLSTAYGDQVPLLRQFDAGAFLDLVEREGAKSVYLVPTMLKKILDHPRFSRERLQSLQLIHYGAAPMPVELIKRAVRELPIYYSNVYGMTETGAAVTQLGPKDHRITGPPEEQEKKLRRLGSVGRPLKGVTIRAVDDGGNDVPPGAVGEIIIRSQRMMDGYLDIPAHDDAHPIKDGWYYSGDMGYIDEDGYIFLAGRNKDMIIRGGENIGPEEIEQVIHAYPGVAEAAVIGVPDDEWGERIMAVVACEPGHIVTADGIRDHCHAHLASYKKPDFVEFIDALPRNPTGKVLKRDLRERFGTRGGDTLC